MEVTALLTVHSRNDISRVEKELDTFNKSGRIGNIPWTANYWKPEGKKREPSPFVVFPSLSLPKSMSISVSITQVRVSVVQSCRNARALIDLKLHHIVL